MARKGGNCGDFNNVVSHRVLRESIRASVFRCYRGDAHVRGVWPRLSSLLGLTSSRPSSVSIVPPMLTRSGKRERCYFHHLPVSARSGRREWCSSTMIWLVGADLFPPKSDFHHSLMSTPSDIPERCLTATIWLVGADLFMPE